MPVDDRDTKAALDRVLLRMRAATSRVVSRGGMVVQRRAQSKLHVGYGVVSGTMRRSVHMDGPVATGEDEYAARVGASVIYARRFDLGFFGTDALGRQYLARGSQPPGLLGSIKRPFIVPAYHESIPLIREIALGEVTAAIEG